MNLHYIVFPTREIEAKALIEVARRMRIDALRNSVYVVSDAGLAVLRDLELEFRAAYDEEIDLEAEKRLGPWSIA